MKIIAKNPRVKSMKLTVPFDGTIDIDANGCAEVSDKCAAALVKGTNDWKYEGEDNSTTQPKIDDENGDEDAKMIAGIKKMKLEELVATATEAGYPESEWKKFANNSKSGAKLMSAYLIKKYNEAKLNDEGENGDEDAK